MIRIGRLPIQTPLGTQLGLSTQPRSDDLGDLKFKIDKNTVINIGLVRLPP